MSIENYERRPDIPVSSPRSFGIVFATVFALVGLYPLLFSSNVRIWALGIGGMFLIVALAAPGVLSPLNRIWFRFGMLLHRIVNPVVLGAMFFLMISPLGIVTRWFGRDFLRMRLDKTAKSYWIDRAPPGPTPESLRDQF